MDRLLRSPGGDLERKIRERNCANEKVLIIIPYDTKQLIMPQHTTQLNNRDLGMFCVVVFEL